MPDWSRTGPNVLLISPLPRFQSGFEGKAHTGFEPPCRIRDRTGQDGTGRPRNLRLAGVFTLKRALRRDRTGQDGTGRDSPVDHRLVQDWSKNGLAAAGG